MTEAVKLRQRLSPTARRLQLLDIAIDLNARKGVGRVGHGDIAKIAGVSTGTVFNYFPTITALNAAVLDAVRLHTLGLFKNAPHDEGSSSVLMFYSQKLLNLVEGQPALFKVFLSWSQIYDAPFRGQFLTMKKEIMAILLGSLRGRDQAEIDAHIIYGTGVLAAQMKLEGSSQEEVLKLAARVTELMA